MNLFKNTFASGVAIILGSEVVVAILLWVGLLIAGIGVSDHLRWFGACFIPPILLLRWLAKKGPGTGNLKGAITTLFITFVAFIFLIFKFQLM